MRIWECQGCFSLSAYNNKYMIRIYTSWHHHLQAFNKFRRFHYQEQITKNGFQGKGKPENSVHSSECILKTAMTMLALACLGM